MLTCIKRKAARRSCSIIERRAAALASALAFALLAVMAGPYWGQGPFRYKRLRTSGTSPDQTTLSPVAGEVQSPKPVSSSVQCSS